MTQTDLYPGFPQEFLDWAATQDGKDGRLMSLGFFDPQTGWVFEKETLNGRWARFGFSGETFRATGDHWKQYLADVFAQYP